MDHVQENQLLWPLHANRACRLVIADGAETGAATCRHQSHGQGGAGCPLMFLTVSIDGVVAVTGRLPFFELTGCTSMLPHLLWLVRWCMRL